MNKQKQAFTLVELIVVITILAILWTIAFISLQWYSRDSRDSVRISDMSSIKTTLELFHLWAGKYPITTDGTPVLYSWTEAWTQGNFWEATVTNVDKFDKIPTDPLMDRQYVYSVTHSKQEYEIAWIVEWDTIWLNSELINEAIAWDKISKIKITWNYNGKFLKLSTWWVDYVLSVPSIITSTGGTLDYILDNNGLAYNWYSNLPLQYDGSPYATMWESPEITLVNAWSVVAYSGSFDTLAEDSVAWDTARTDLITNGQDAYTWTVIADEYEIAEIITVDLTDTWAVDYIAKVVVNIDLWWNITIPVNETSGWFDGGWPTPSRFAWYDEVWSLPEIHFTYLSTGDDLVIDDDISSNVTGPWLIALSWNWFSYIHRPEWWAYSGIEYADIQISKIELWSPLVEVDLSSLTLFAGEYDATSWTIRNTDWNSPMVIQTLVLSWDLYRVTFTATELTYSGWWAAPSAMPIDLDWSEWWWWWEG